MNRYWQYREVEIYDTNGNREYAGQTNDGVGADNQLAADNTYHYTYDGEGNRTARYVWTDSNHNGNVDAGETSDITTYSWDNRNRLTEVKHRQTETSAIDLDVVYHYDTQNRLIYKDALTGSGTSAVEQQTVSWSIRS